MREAGTWDLISCPLILTELCGAQSQFPWHRTEKQGSSALQARSRVSRDQLITQSHKKAKVVLIPGS